MPRVEPENRYPIRKNLRLSGFDYTQPGMYFVTICTWDRRCCFGDVIDGRMVHSPLGEMISDMWRRTPQRHDAVSSDEFVVMPNHLHGLLLFGTSAPSLSSVVGAFKSLTMMAARKEGLLAPGKLWQRGFYDHVVRDEEALSGVREYIQNNPLKWHLDRENPGNIESVERRAGTSPAPTAPGQS